MKVYLAASYLRRDELRKYAKDLEEMGIEVTSSWLAETVDPKKEPFSSSEHKRKVATRDLFDISESDVLIVFSEPTSRGGHIFESGYAFGQGLDIFVVGEREIAFHHLPEINVFSTWGETKEALKSYIGG